MHPHQILRPSAPPRSGIDSEASSSASLMTSYKWGRVILLTHPPPHRRIALSSARIDFTQSVWPQPSTGATRLREACHYGRGKPRWHCRHLGRHGSNRVSMGAIVATNRRGNPRLYSYCSGCVVPAYSPHVAADRPDEAISVSTAETRMDRLCLWNVVRPTRRSPSTPRSALIAVVGTYQEHWGAQIRCGCSGCTDWLKPHKQRPKAGRH